MKGCQFPNPDTASSCSLCTPCLLAAGGLASGRRPQQQQCPRRRLTVALPCSGTISLVPTKAWGTTLTCVASASWAAGLKCRRALRSTLHTVPR